MIRPQGERQGGESKRERERKSWGERDQGRGGGGREAEKTWKREMGWGARQRSRQRDGAVKKGETVRPRKDRAAAPAYQLFHEISALISINSNDKCGPLWQRLINSRRGETHQSKNSNHSMPQAWTSVKRERVELHCVWNYYCSLTCPEKVIAFILVFEPCCVFSFYVFCNSGWVTSIWKSLKRYSVAFWKIFHFYTVCVGGCD